MLYTDSAPFPAELLELLGCDDRELLVRLLVEDLLELTALDELLLEGGKLGFELDDSKLDEDLLDVGAVDELVATDPHEPKSLHAFVHAQPTPGSYGPPSEHQPPTVHENARLLFLTIWPAV